MSPGILAAGRLRGRRVVSVSAPGPGSPPEGVHWTTRVWCASVMRRASDSGRGGACSSVPGRRWPRLDDQRCAAAFRQPSDLGVPTHAALRCCTLHAPRDSASRPPRRRLRALHLLGRWGRGRNPRVLRATASPMERPHRLCVDGDATLAGVRAKRKLSRCRSQTPSCGRCICTAWRSRGGVSSHVPRSEPLTGLRPDGLLRITREYGNPQKGHNSMFTAPARADLDLADSCWAIRSSDVPIVLPHNDLCD